jgi:hypothetical protein
MTKLTTLLAKTLLITPLLAVPIPSNTAVKEYTTQPQPDGIRVNESGGGSGSDPSEWKRATSPDGIRVNESDGGGNKVSPDGTRVTRAEDFGGEVTAEGGNPWHD